MDPTEFDRSLAGAYDAAPGERRAVVRAAVDLSDSGGYREHAGTPVTPDLVLSELADAPSDYGLAERWNWWMGALELAHGGYDRFTVDRWTQE